MIDWDELNDIEREIEYGSKSPYWQVRADLKRDGTPQGRVWEVTYQAWPWEARSEGLVLYHGGTAWAGVVSNVSAEDARVKFAELIQKRQAYVKRYPWHGPDATCSI